MVQALEDLVVEETSVFYFRVYAWWLSLHSWGTLRFSDHQCLVPDDRFEVRGNTLSARLTRSKTIGSDTALSCRSVGVSSASSCAGQTGFPRAGHS